MIATSNWPEPAESWLPHSLLINPDQYCPPRKSDTDVSKNERCKRLLAKWSAILDAEDNGIKKTIMIEPHVQWKNPEHESYDPLRIVKEKI